MLKHVFKGHTFVFRDLSWEEDILLSDPLSTLSKALDSVDEKKITPDLAAKLLSKFPTNVLDTLWMEYGLSTPPMREMVVEGAPWRAPRPDPPQIAPGTEFEEGESDESY